MWREVKPVSGSYWVYLQVFLQIKLTFSQCECQSCIPFPIISCQEVFLFTLAYIKKKIQFFSSHYLFFFPPPLFAIIVLIYWELNGISVSIFFLLNTLLASSSTFSFSVSPQVADHRQLTFLLSLNTCLNAIIGFYNRDFPESVWPDVLDWRSFTFIMWFLYPLCKSNNITNTITCPNQ